MPERRSIVISGTLGFQAPGAVVVDSLPAAMAAAGDDPEEVFVIGGAAVYRDALPGADRLYLTVVHAEIEGDVRFPDPDLHGWQLRQD